MFRGNNIQEADARRSARTPSSLEGKIYLNNGAAVSCKISDLSTGGARIEVQENAKTV
ncbi:PilZ domain-containing protein [Microvirga puerhi]|uniref:PilZ domain-containing protein n=1 Tax=Microvirga puerhi TaxID=2876078 RepID=UPI0034E20549